MDRENFNTEAEVNRLLDEYFAGSMNPNRAADRLMSTYSEAERKATLEYMALSPEERKEWIREHTGLSIQKGVTRLLTKRRATASRAEDVIDALEMFTTVAAYSLGAVGVTTAETTLFVGLCFASKYPELARLIPESFPDSEITILMDQIAEMIEGTVRGAWKELGVE